MHIKVTIPVQEYDEEKYIGTPCYLEQALMDAGYKNVYVGAIGRTRIDGKHYKPVTPFSCGILRDSFERNEPVNVVLIPA